MNIRYFTASGIHSWAEPLSIEDQSYCTTTIILSNGESKNTIWKTIINNLKDNNQAFNEWRILQAPTSKTQELITKNKIRKSADGELTFTINPSSRVHGYICTKNHITEEDIDRARDYRHSFFAVTNCELNDCLSLFNKITHKNFISGPEASRVILDSIADTIVIRAFPNETHETLQLITLKNLKIKILSALEIHNPTEISPKDTYLYTK